MCVCVCVCVHDTVFCYSIEIEPPSLHRLLTVALSVTRITLRYTLSEVVSVHIALINFIEVVSILYVCTCMRAALLSPRQPLRCSILAKHANIDSVALLCSKCYCTLYDVWHTLMTALSMHTQFIAVYKIDHFIL